MEVRDVDGNRVTTGTHAVTLTIGTNPSGGILSGALTQNTVKGLAVFTGLRIDKAGTGYTLQATVPELADAASHTFDILPRPATKLAFTTQPVDGLAGEVLGTEVVVEIQNELGEQMATANNLVTLAIGTNPTGGALSGTLTRAAANGVALFTGLSIDKAGRGYTLKATANNLTGAVSGDFDISPQPPKVLVFTVQPQNTTAGDLITPDIVVEVRDQNGSRITTADHRITLAISSNPSSGVLSGTVTQPAVNGVATFYGLRIDQAGAGYKLQATAPGLTATTSNAFEILPQPATRLAFTVQPSHTMAGEDLLPALKVELRNRSGELVTTSSLLVSLAISSNPSGGMLTGSVTQATSNGVATFSDLKIDKPGQGYQLKATAAGLSGAISNLFDITPRPATKLAFIVQPADTVAGVNMSPTVVVEIRNSLGQRVESAGNLITLALGTNPVSATLTGTLTRATVNGRATFPGLVVDKAGENFQLQATALNLTGALSDAFNILPRPATKLAFTTQPGHVQMGSNISPPLVVELRDELGQRAEGDNRLVSLAISTNPTGGTLLGTVTRAAVNGVATFSGLSLDKVGNGYKLQATALGLTGTLSDSFNVLPRTDSYLAFTVQPANTPQGDALTPAIEVEVRDYQGQRVTTSNKMITLSLGTNPDGGTLSGTLSRAAENGRALFPGLSLDKIAKGYTLQATANGLTTAVSSAFDILHQPATGMVFSIQPQDSLVGTGIAPDIVVELQDKNGQRAATANNPVTLAIAENPAGGVLSGTVTQSAENGLATFPGLSINKAGKGYTVKALSAGLTSTTSAPFEIQPLPATHLVFTVQPGTVSAGERILPEVVVEIRNGQGERVTTADHQVSLAIGTNPNHGVLLGALTRTAVNGRAVFPNLSIDREGSGYTLQATAQGLSDGLSASFNILPRPSIRLAFTVQPRDTVAEAGLSPDIVVEVQNALGERVTMADNMITMEIGDNPAGGALAGTLSRAAANGVATFPGLSIDKPGLNYTLRAVSQGLSSAFSDKFEIKPLPAVQLTFTIQPGTVSAGESFIPDLVVEIQNSKGQRVATANHTVTLSIGTNPAGGVLRGILTRSAVNGVATFPAVTIDKPGQGYKLQATAIGLNDGHSDPFNILTALPHALAFIIQPANTLATQPFTPGLTVEVQNKLGQRVEGATQMISLAMGNNAGNGTLSGILTRSAANGLAAFPGLSIDKIGSSYTLTATADGLMPDTSHEFDIQVGPPDPGRLLRPAHKHPGGHAPIAGRGGGGSGRRRQPGDHG